MRRREMILACAGLGVAPGLVRAILEEGFEPEIGVCRGPGDAAVAKAAGAAYLEIGCAAELRPLESDEDVAARLEAIRTCGLPCRRANGFLPGSLKATGPDADHDAVLAYAKVAFERAASVGMTAITFGSSGSRSLASGFDRREAELQFTALLARMAGPAEEAGVVVCVEPLRKQETNFINRVSEAARIVGAIDHPNIRITADIYHMLVEDEGADAIRKAGGLVHHVHIAEEDGRRAPGTGGEDFRAYLRALKDVGYEGLISIECGWRDFGVEAAGAVGALQEQIARV
jgi:sugar phosphate isomerase/epimerase